MGRDPRRSAAQRRVRLGGQELELGSPVLDAALLDGRRAYLEQRAELAPLPPAAERSAMTEGAWQKQILELARRLGVWVYHPKLSRWSAQGWPDLSLLGRRRAMWLECKSDGGQLTEAQVDVFLRMRAAGLHVRVVRPHDGLELVGALLAALHS